MILVTNDFFKNIPIEYKEIVMKKLEYFKKNIIENKNKIRSIPKGFWIRKIKNTDIYKFRLNNSDRILFTFVENRIDYMGNNSGTQDNILLLDYCKHDKQIERGKRLNVNCSKNKAKLFKIDKNSLEDKYEQNDENNKYVQNYIKQKYLDLNEVVSFVVDDRYLAVLLDNKNNDYLYYLSNEQFQCFKSLGKPIILSGAAGSGKTTVAAHKLFWCYKNNLKVAYFTFTDLLSEEANTIFNKFKYRNQNSEPKFYSINKFYSEVFNIDYCKVVRYSTFSKWFVDNKYKYNSIKKIDSMDIWTEIRGIIKGYIGLEGTYVSDFYNKNEECISLKEYINLPDNYSIFNKEEKKVIYKVCLDYQNWIKDKYLYDENELSIQVLKKIDNNEIEKYDFLIIDEVQDLSEIQLYMLSKLVKDPNNIMFSGDIHQIVNPTFFSFGRLKNVYYGQGIEVNQYILTKNYRNTSEIVNILNKLVKERKRLIGSSKYDYEEKHIRDGEKAKVINYNTQSLKELLELVKDKHYCAIVVPNEEERKMLIQISKEASGRIFTVNEIKGLEYENVYCVNIISANEKYWNDIYNGFGKRNSKYRYYFNQLYVAVSRAKNNLYLYEKELNSSVLNSIKEYIEISMEVNKEALNLVKESTKEEWKIEATRLEKVDRIDKSEFARNKSLEEKVLSRNRRFDESFFNQYSDIQKKKITDRNNQVDKLLNEGYEYFQKRHFNNAIKYYEQALKVDPDNFKIYYHMANTFSYMLGGMENSLKYFDECLRLKNDFYLAYIDKAAVLNALGRQDEEIKVLKQAITVEPNCSNAYMMLGRVYLEKRNFENAKYYAEKALEFDGYVWDSYNHFWEKVKRGTKKDTNINSIKSILKDIKSQKKYNKMNDYSTEKSVQKSLKEDDAVEDNFINNHELEYAEANKLFELGHYKDAIPVFNKLLEYPNVPKTIENYVYANLCGCYTRCKEFDKALKYGKLSVQDNLDNYDGYNNLGTLYLNIGKYEEAIKCYKQAMKGELWCDVAKNGIELAKVYIENEKKTGIRKITLTAQEFEVLNSEIIQNIIDGNIKVAETIVTDSIRKYNLDNSWESGCYGLIATFYYQQGDIKRTIEYLFKSIDVNSNNEISKQLYKQVTGKKYKKK